jgi:protocatechuate 3,4-dioxygenase beta subunit
MSHRRPLASCGWIWISASLLTAPAAAAAEYSFHGRLVGPKGQPVAGALVTATMLPEGREAFAARFGDVETPEAGRTRSGEDGVFDLLVPAEGFYRIRIGAKDFLPVEQTFLVASPEPVLLPLSPLRAARRVKVGVQGPDGGKLAGARIRAEAPGGGLDLGAWQAFAATGENGVAELLEPAEGEVEVYAAAAGLAGAQGRLAAGTERLELRLVAGSPLEVEVRDGRGRPLPEVLIFLADARLPLGATGKDGKAQVRVTAGQKHFGLADAAGREGLAGQRPRPGEPAEGPPRLRVQLDDPRPVAGQVVARGTRQPVEGAWVYIYGSRLPVAARSGRTGNFELPRPFGGLQPLVAAFKAGYRLGHGAYSELASEVAIELEPASRLDGRVLDASGQPVAGAIVAATFDERPFEHGFPTFAVSRRDGTFALSDLPLAASVKIKAFSGRLASKLVEKKIAPGEPATVELTMESPAALAVRVVDPRGEPVAHAEVYGSNRSNPRPHLLDYFAPETPDEDGLQLLGFSDSEGRLRAANISPGDYDLAAQASQLARGTLRRVAVGAGGEREVELRLRPAVTVKGRVVGEDAAGIAGAALYLTPVPDDPSSDRLQSGGTPAATSGAGGDFVVAGVDPERLFHLVATKEGFAPAKRLNLVLGNDPLVIVLERGGRVAGRVSAGGRHPGPVGIELVAEAGAETGRMRLFDDSLFGIWVVLDAGGSFAYDQVKPGRYHLKVREARGYQPYEGEIFELRAGETRVVEEIELQPAVVVKGVLLQPDGQPALGANVTLGSPDEREASSYHGTDSAGRFHIGTATAGRTSLKVIAPGFRELLREVDLVPGENSFELTLEPGAIVLGAKVVDTEGAVVAGAEISVSGRHHLQATSDAEGRVRLAGLESGKYLLLIRKEGYASTARELAVEQSAQDLEWIVEPAKAKLAGAVLGLGPDSCADLRIRLNRNRDAPVLGKCENGRYQVENLAAGKQTLIAGSATTGRVVARQVEILAGESEIQLDLDFRALAGPWSARLRLGDQDLRNVRYSLQAPGLGTLLVGLSADGRIELHADPGRYQLSVQARPMEEPRQIEIEIGAPSEQLIDASEP